MTELEAKFLIENPQQVSAILEAVHDKAGALKAARVEDTLDIYVDTKDLRLYRNGLLCRWQVDGGECKFSAVSWEPPGKKHQRVAVDEPTVSLPESFKDIPTGPAGKKVRSIVKKKELCELFRVRKQKRSHADGPTVGAAVELEIDETSIRAAKKHSKLAPGELHFEEMRLNTNGRQADLVHETAKALEGRFDLVPARLSDFERGIQAAGLDLPNQHTEFDKLPATDAVVKLVYQYLGQQFTEVLFHEPRAWEALDPEGVHQMRVATRRIRAILRAFKAMLPKAAVKRVNCEFRWLARLLGDVRDLDVYLMNFDRYTAELPAAVAGSLEPYRVHLEKRWAASRKELLAGLSSEQFDRLVDHFQRFRDECPSANAPSPSIQEAAAEMVDRRLKKVLKCGRAVTKHSPPEELHAVRIQGKRLRYLLEFFQPFYGKRFKSLIRRTKAIQDVLGDHQDACVASQRLQAYADSLSQTEDDRQLRDALNCLIASQNVHAKHERKTFPAVWAKFDQPKLRKQLRKLL